ncbi:MAG: PIN domain nuclease [Micrococcales bacterium]|nr:PIN domain nuclease [Micrococcales bacterium]
MATVIMLDTHVAVWLHTNAISNLSQRGLSAIETNDLVVSPAVELELAYLHEVGRTAGPASEVLGFLGSTLGLTVAQIGFGPLCALAVGLTWTRDPFDRLLAAHAVAADLPLLTKDRSLRQHLELAFWD